MFNDKRVTKQWKTIFKVMIALWGICMVLPYMEIVGEWKNLVHIIGLIIGLLYLILLWFLYNAPHKLNMEEKD